MIYFKVAIVLCIRTVAVLMAHIYGKRFDLQPFIDICHSKNIAVLEDCAQTFGGFNYRGKTEYIDFLLVFHV